MSTFDFPAGALGSAAPAPRYAQGSRERYTRATPLRRIFRAIPAKWAGLPASSVYANRHQANALLGFVLMACVAEQLTFLCAVWEEMLPDDDVITAFKALVKTGNFLDVMDHTSQDARARILLTYNGVMEARGKL